MASLIFILLSCLTAITLSIRPYRLRVEYMNNPYGIDVASPRFFWAVDTEGVRGGDQTAFQIKVYSVSAKGSESLVADSGKVASNQTTQIVIDKFTVASHSDYRWSVVIYNASDAVSTNNPNGFFSAALLIEGRLRLAQCAMGRHTQLCFKGQRVSNQKQ